MIDVDKVNQILCIYANKDQAQIERCYSAVINQPNPLQVNSIINYNINELNLDLRGGEEYFVELNGKLYEYEKNQEVKLFLNEGINKFKVFTNQACQGSYEKIIYTGKNAYVSPNPVRSNTKIFLPYYSSKIEVNLYNIDGDHLDSRIILIKDETKSFDWYMEKYLPGIYLMNIITKESEFTVKIIKK